MKMSSLKAMQKFYTVPQILIASATANRHQIPHNSKAIHFSVTDVMQKENFLNDSSASYF